MKDYITWLYYWKLPRVFNADKPYINFGAFKEIKAQQEIMAQQILRDRGEVVSLESIIND